MALSKREKEELDYLPVFLRERKRAKRELESVGSCESKRVDSDIRRLRKRLGFLKSKK